MPKGRVTKVHNIFSNKHGEIGACITVHLGGLNFEKGWAATDRKSFSVNREAAAVMMAVLAAKRALDHKHKIDRRWPLTDYTSKEPEDLNVQIVYEEFEDGTFKGITDIRF